MRKRDSENTVKKEPVKLNLDEKEREILLSRTRNEITQPLINFGLAESDIKRIVKELLPESVLRKDDLKHTQIFVKNDTVDEYILALMYLGRFATKSAFEALSECFETKTKYGYMLEILRKSDICFHTDWKFEEQDINAKLNNTLKKHGLKASFLDYVWSKNSSHPSFIVELFGGKNKHTRILRYLDERLSSLTELMAVINTLLKPYNLIFADARSGNDDYNFVLFRIEQYDELKRKYPQLPLFYEPYVGAKYFLLNTFWEWKNILLRPSSTLKDLKYGVQERTLYYSLVILATAGLISFILSRATILEEIIKTILEQKQGAVFLDPVVSIGAALFFGIAIWIGIKISGHKASISKWLPLFNSASAPVIAIMNVPFLGIIAVLYGVYIIYRLVGIFTLFSTKRVLAILSFSYVLYIVIGYLVTIIMAM